MSREQGRWEPVRPGLHYIEYADVGMTVSIDGSLLTMQSLDDEYEMSVQLDPKEYRLCRWQKGTDNE